MVDSPLSLPSGCTVDTPFARLLAFCEGEYAYYDAIPSGDPNRIEPLDVLVTVAMNSFVNSAAKVHRVHQGMAAGCNPLLPSIPLDADLLELERWQQPLRNLLHAAVQAPWVLIPVATKVLFRKRRGLIPMLDSVVIRHYLDNPEHKKLLPGTENKAKAADVAMVALQRLRADLVAAQGRIEGLCESLDGEGYTLSAVRALELLVWTQVEPAGYYRG